MTKEKLYNKLSAEYDKLFAENIIQFQRNSLKEQNTVNKYVDFYPSFGTRKKHCEFLIYGQAVNDWGTGFNVEKNEIEIAKKVRESIEFSNSYLDEKNHTPLDWVNVHWSKNTYIENTKTKSEKEFYPEMKYNTFRSFFWNVTYKLINGFYDLGDDSWDWSKKIIWSNLYKISPSKGNPNLFERNLQLELSIELVRKEIEEIKPEFCIVLTNEDWWKPFQQKLNTSRLENKSNPQVISFEQYGHTKIVLTTRPFRGSSDKHVSQILKLIGRKN